MLWCWAVADGPDLPVVSDRTINLSEYSDWSAVIIYHWMILLVMQQFRIPRTPDSDRPVQHRISGLRSDRVRSHTLHQSGGLWHC